MFFPKKYRSKFKHNVAKLQAYFTSLQGKAKGLCWGKKCQ